jgi:hypothetical protein
MAKEIQVSDDNGSNWYTLPGSTGDMNQEAGQLNDTIFGQTFQSNQPGLVMWMITGQALYKGFAGYVCTIKKSGTPTTMTDEAMSLVSGKTYKITDAAKACIDLDTAVVVEDNASPVAAADILNIDYLHGRVTFAASYTPTGPITITGKYLPLSTLGTSQSFTLTQTAAEIRTTTFAIAQANNGFHTHDPGLRQANLEVQGIFDIANAYLNLLLDRETLLIEVNPDGGGKSVARGFFKAQTHGQTGDVGALEEETVQFLLQVPSNEKLKSPFSWLHASDTTLPTAIQKILDAWQNETKLKVRYLPTGEVDTEGVVGDAIVTECTMTGGLEAMNEFRCSFRGDGALAATA